MSTPGERRADELLAHLESEQLVAQTRQPVPPAHLGRRARAGLWALRVAVVVLSAMALYAFVEQLA
jgi:hypothetical protein